MPKSSPYIFGIGPPKSGSHSLAIALEMLGIKTVHTGRVMGESGRASGVKLQDDLSAALAAAADNYTADLFAGIPAVANVSAIVDWPIWNNFRTIDRCIPDAKFILTYRNPDDCAFSWARQVSRQPQLWASPHADYDVFLRVIRSLYSSVSNYFLRRPDKLLFLTSNVPGTENIKALAHFLDVPVPDNVSDYPTAFKHQTWHTACQAKKTDIAGKKI